MNMQTRTVLSIPGRAPVWRMSVIIFVFLLASHAFAQSPHWAWGLGQENPFTTSTGSVVARDGAGNVYVTGRTWGVDVLPGPGEVWLGDPSDNEDFDTYVCKYSTAGYYLGGLALNSVTGTSLSHGITVDDSGNIYLTGSFVGVMDFDPGPDVHILEAVTESLFVCKLDNGGNLVWARNIGGSSLVIGRAVAINSSGQPVVTGEFSGTADFDPGPGVVNLTATLTDAFILNLSASGDFLWAGAVEGAGNEYGNSITTDNSGNCYVTGTFTGSADFDPGPGSFTMSDGDVFVMKVNSAGALSWAKEIAGNGSNGHSIAWDELGNVVITGDFGTTADFDPGSGTYMLSPIGTDAFVCKLTSAGSFVWAKVVGGPGFISGAAITSAGGDVYVCGNFSGDIDFDPGPGVANLDESADGFVLKLDPSGNYQWALSIVPFDNGETISGISATGSDVAIAGTIYGNGVYLGDIYVSNGAWGPGFLFAKIEGVNGTLPTVMIIDSTNILCGGSSTGSVTAAGSGGSTPYTFEWSNGEFGPTIEDLPAGTYTVTLTDDDGNAATATVTLTEPEPILVNATVMDAACHGAADGTISASASGGVPPFSFTWSHGASGPTAIALTAGIYTLTLTDGNACEVTEAYAVGEPEPIGITAVALASESCAGAEDGAITIDIGGGTMPYAAVWSNGQTGLSLVNLAPGNYSVTVTDAHDCVESTDYVIEAGTLVEIMPVAIQPVICAGDNNGSITVEGSGGSEPYSYLWSNGQTEAQATGLPAGDYAVTITEAGGCAVSETYMVSGPDPLLDSISQTGEVYCQGDSTGSLVVTIMGGIPPYTYLWSTGMTGDTVTALPAGTYTLTTTDSNGCTVADTMAIPEPPMLSDTLAVTNETGSGANDGTIMITLEGGIGPYDLLWSNGDTTTMLTGLAPGVYSVTVTDANGCVLEDEAQVFAFGCALNLVQAEAMLLCAGDTGLVAPAYAGNSGPLSFVWSDGSTGETLAISETGTYCLTVTDGAGCADSECYDAVAVSPGPFDCPVTDETAPGMADGSIGCDGLPGIASYLWSNGSTEAIIDSLSAGTYCVTVTDMGGCTAVECFDVEVSECQVPVTDAVSHIPCHGDTAGMIVLMAGQAIPPVHYAWSTGDTTSVLGPLPAGLYVVTITDGSGCETIITYAVGEPDALALEVDSTWVEESSTGSIEITITGGVPPYQYLWTGPDGMTYDTEDLDGLDTLGIYQLMVTDANGCTQAFEVILEDTQTATNDVSPVLPLRFYPNPASDVIHIQRDYVFERIEVFGIDGRPCLQVTNPGTNQLDISGLPEGCYQVRATDGRQWYVGRVVKTAH